VLQARELGDLLRMPDFKRQTRRPGKANELIVQPLVTLGVLRLSLTHTAVLRDRAWSQLSQLLIAAHRAWTGSMLVRKCESNSLVVSSNPTAECKTGVRPRAFVDGGRCATVESFLNGRGPRGAQLQTI